MDGRYYTGMLYFTRAYHLAGHPPTLEPIRSTMKAVNRHGRRAGSVAATLRRQD